MFNEIHISLLELGDPVRFSFHAIFLLLFHVPSYNSSSLFILFLFTNAINRKIAKT